MVNTRSWYNDSQWVEYGDGDGAYTAAYASGTSFTIAGVDVTLIYHAGRRIKIVLLLLLELFMEQLVHQLFQQTLQLM
jgi:hypothetical protein